MQALPTLLVKKKSGSKWLKIDIDIQQVSAADFMVLKDQDVVLEFKEAHRVFYASPMESVRVKWETTKAGCQIMDWDMWCNFWQFKMLEFAYDTFCMQENREERRSICEADKIPEVEIQKIFASQPMLYGGIP